MRFTKRDLRSPRETLGDVIGQVKVTRADLIFLNTLIGMANQSHDIPQFQQHNLQIAQLLAAEEMRPGTMSLIRQSPGLYDKHIVEFTKDMVKIQEEYYEKHPEKRPKIPPASSVTSVEPTDESEVQRVVDAESTQQVEQSKVEPEEV